MLLFDFSIFYSTCDGTKGGYDDKIIYHELFDYSIGISGNYILFNNLTFFWGFKLGLINETLEPYNVLGSFDIIAGVRFLPFKVKISDSLFYRLGFEFMYDKYILPYRQHEIGYDYVHSSWNPSIVRFGIYWLILE